MQSDVEHHETQILGRMIGWRFQFGRMAAFFGAALVAFGVNAGSPTDPACRGNTRKLVSRHCVDLKPRRVVIVTARNRKDRLREQDEYAKTLANHLRNINCFDVVVAREGICCDHLPTRTGQFDEHELVRLSRRFNADTVLYCEVQQISAYEPMRLQSNVLLVSAAEAVALVSATSTFDLNHPVTRSRYARYVNHRCSNAAVDTFLSSPSQLIDFAASEAAGVLASVWPQE